ncbi:MAG: acyl-CoA dehydrogenase family protein [Pseudonocardiaceae bacterium]
MTTFRPTTGGRLFDRGLFGPHVDEFRADIRAVLAKYVIPQLEQAERDGLFPVAVLRDLGAAGVFRRRWNSSPYGDPGAGVVISQEAARLGVTGIAVGLSLHLETVASALIKFSTTPLLREYADGVLDGRLVGCLGASEPAGGSDLAGITTRARRVVGGWHVTGEKKYLSLGLVCDFALILARIVDEDDAEGLLGLFAVPASGLRVRKRHDKLGTSSLDTTWMVVDVVVGDDAVLARPGLGLLATTWALSHERLAVAAQACGGCAKAIGLAVAHLRRRTQFGSPLFEHQALRLRLAELFSRLTVLEYSVYAAASGIPVAGSCGPRELAALKVTAARFAEEVMSECMHIFGGSGYLVDETPLARMWRDARLARLGAGSDEMMWELVAGGLIADDEGYAESVDIG